MAPLFNGPRSCARLFPQVDRLADRPVSPDFVPAQRDFREQGGGAIVGAAVSKLGAGERLHRAQVVGVEVVGRRVGVEGLVDVAGVLEREAEVDAGVGVIGQEAPGGFEGAGRVVQASLGEADDAQGCCSG